MAKGYAYSGSLNNLLWQLQCDARVKVTKAKNNKIYITPLFYHTAEQIAICGRPPDDQYALYDTSLIFFWIIHNTMLLWRTTNSSICANSYELYNFDTEYCII